MRFYIFLLTVTLFFTACGNNSETPKNSTNNAKPAIGNTAIQPTNANQPSNAPTNLSNLPAGTIAKPDADKTNDAKTLSTVITAYSEALKSKNDAALRKVLSQPTIKAWEDEMKSEGKTKFAEYVAESEYVEGKPYEIRNEEIKGDEAIAEIKGGVFGKWTPIVFVKENGEWKKTDESPQFKSVVGNANTAQKIAPK